MLFTVISTRGWYSLLWFLVFMGLDISTATAESGWGLGFVYIITLFTFESSMFFSQLKLYLDVNTETTIRKLTENQTIPVVSETRTKSSINDENLSLFMNNIF
jgi:hypothetical protein